jgi:hypothetical protein
MALAAALPQIQNAAPTAASMMPRAGSEDRRLERIEKVDIARSG